MNNFEFENLVKENQKLKYELSSLSKDSKKTQQELKDEINKLREINAFSHEKIQELEKIISLMENSRSWKMTKNARSIGDKLRKIKKIYQLFPVAIKSKGGIISFSKLFYSKIKQGGIKNLRYSIQTFINHNQAQHIPTITGNHKENIDFLFNVNKNPNDIFNTTVVIVAEMSIPQCTKYRVTQKKELFESLGIKCEVVSWTDYFKAKHLLSLSSLAIFYRVPAYDSVMSLIGECKRLGIRTFWEVDDLIFDTRVLENSRTINSLDSNTISSLLEGARLYREAMIACGEGIASTPGLAQEMINAGLKNAYIIENALDLQTLNTATAITSQSVKSEPDKLIRIVYGSGTSTHNIDFEEAAPSLARILKENKDVIFRIIGILDLPDYFNGLESQIERIGFCQYDEYLRYLSECDISIAPLENYIFNESKSNIKYIEASIVKVASISSPLSAFTSVITNGENGLIAKSQNEWYQGFSKLINDKKYRLELADAAYKNVLQHYEPSQIAKQLKVLLPKQVKKQRKRLISFNVFYRPRSFGGATIVAEQINDLIVQDQDYEVFVVTTLPQTSYLQPYGVTRYELNGTTIFGICVPNDAMEQYENKNVYNVISDILDLVDPDIAHIHCIQGLGVGALDACTQRNIKTVVTLHDAWWICPRQFMIKGNGKFCNQYKIDQKECIKCINSTSEYLYRSNTLLNSLNKANILLAPSKYFTDLYEINLGRKVFHNKNGIKMPKLQLPKFRNKVIRFGYVGGRTNIKGVHLILEAFKKYQFKNAELVVVDNLLNLGQKSYPESDFDGIANYEILPAYTQDNIDDFFNSIDVLLFPTQCKESFGLTVREAIVRNVWVITTDVGGPVEDIIEGVNGNIIPFDSDYKVLAKAIQNTIDLYMNKALTDEIVLEKRHIASFEDQKDELISIIQGAR